MEKERSEELSSFLETGIYRLANSSNAVFMDPVRVLNSSYTRFRVSHSKYYSRSEGENGDGETVRVRVSVPENSARKRKRRNKSSSSSYILNEREQFAEKRHQEARPFLLKAHEAFVRATDLLDILCHRWKDGLFSTGNESLSNVKKDIEPSFIDLGRIWQAPLYEISLYPHNELADDKGAQFGPQVVVPIFNNLITNEANDDMEAKFLNSWYILPRKSCFHMVKGDGSLISKLDLFHHRPYECLLLGYIYNKVINAEAPLRSKSLLGNQVIISIPGDHSRKPPLGNLLVDYIPGPKPARCLELFARELVAGWTSWGNEPLRFQNLNYFAKKTAEV